MDNEKPGSSRDCTPVYSLSQEQSMINTATGRVNYNYICPKLSTCRLDPCPYKLHANSAYKWVIVDESGEKVVSSKLSYDKYKILEKQYCNPDLTHGGVGKWSVNFAEMTASEEGQSSISRKIQRNSTPPRVLCPTQPHATGWVWYWQSDDVDVIWSEMKVKREQCVEKGEDIPFEKLEQLYQESIIADPEGKNNFIRKLELCGTREVYSVALNFSKMTMTMFGDDDLLYEVRRRPATFSTFVDWCYFDEGMIGINWVTFGDLNAEGDVRYPITVQELESHYINRGCHESFTIQDYRIELTQNKKQMILPGKSKKAVRIRREIFQSGQLVPLETYPGKWDPMPKSRIYVTVNVPAFTKEFKKIENLVPYDITCLRRIQNPASYKSYIHAKSRLESYFPETEIKEEWLFHGTSDLNIKLICEMNFDPTLAGTARGTRYGMGTYFARDPVKCRKYCLSRPPTIKMFVCRVLVGQIALGGRRHNPPDDIGITLVNDVDAPTVFVNRMPHSFRPEYIVEMNDFSS